MTASDNRSAASVDRCWINSGGFALDGKTHMTGAQIRALPMPSIRDTDDLYMEVPGSEDVLVQYDEVVPVAGRRFFSVPSIINAGSPDAAFVAAPSWRRTLRRWRRVGRFHAMTWLFDRGIIDGEKVVGSFWRERRGERTEIIVVTRRKREHGKLMIVPPGEWAQDEADGAIRRGQELAREHGW